MEHYQQKLAGNKETWQQTRREVNNNVFENFNMTTNKATNKYEHDLEKNPSRCIWKHGILDVRGLITDRLT